MENGQTPTTLNIVFFILLFLCVVTDPDLAGQRSTLPAWGPGEESAECANRHPAEVWRPG